MSRGKQGILTFIAALATVVAVAVAPVSAVTSSGSTVAATDEREPAPVTGLEAFPGPDGVELSWELSASDFVRQAPAGTDFTSGGTFVNVNDVAGYRILRNDQEIDTVPAGETSYIDVLAAGAGITYTVVAFDAAGNEAASAPAIVSLGPPPTAVIDDTPIDFGEFASDETDTVVLTIENDAEDPEALLTATFNVEGGNGFSVTPSTVQVEAGGSAEVEVTFAAAAVDNFNGDYEDVLTVRTNDPELSEVLIDLSASITEGVTNPDILVVPEVLAFSTRVVINNSATKTVTISNVGGLPLTGTIALAGDPEFTIDNDAEFVLDADEDLPIVVTFAPTAPGSFSAELTIESDDPDEPTVVVPISGGAVEAATGPGTVVATVAKAAVRVAKTIDLTNEAEKQAFLDDFLARIAEILGISVDRLKVLDVRTGSTIVEFQITNEGGAADEPDAATAVETLVSTIEEATTDTTVADPLADFGGSEEVIDQTEVIVLQPLDENGEPVLGWFTRVEDQVGLADFFAFADEFGKSSTDPDFDDAFDIAPETPDGIVELADFFVFADNFGKVVANADEIRAALQ